MSAGWAWVATLVGFACLAAGVRLGRAVWRRPERPARRLLYASLPAVAAWVVFLEFVSPALAARWPAWVGFELAPLLVCVPAAHLALVRLAPPHWLRRPLRLFVPPMLAFGALHAAAPALLWHGAFGLAPADNSPDVRQSTWWTCGPCAVASLARADGVRVGEAEAARYCLPRPFLGTTNAGLAAGLASLGCPPRVLHGRRDLAGLPAPFLAVTHETGGVIHATCVLSVDDTAVVRSDPMYGRTRQTPAEFERRWLGIVVVVARLPQVSKRSGGEP